MPERTYSLHIEIPLSLHKRLEPYLGYGLKSRVGVAMFEMLAIACEQYGSRAVGAVLLRRWNPVESAIDSEEVKHGPN